MKKNLNGVLLNARLLAIVGGFLSLSILGGAYLLEYYAHLTPCPLCYLQRYMLWGICIVFWLSALHNSTAWGCLVYSAGLLLFSVLGALLAARQLWLQYSPPEAIPNCLAGFEKMLEFKPLWEVLKEILVGTQDCARIDFHFLSLSLAAWSLLSFIAFFIFSLFLGCVSCKKRRI